MLSQPLLLPPMLRRIEQLSYRQLNYLRSPFWWVRKLHPWSAFALLTWRWVMECDRRGAHQIRLQKQLLRLDFREIQQFCTDFIRPEFWLM